MRKLFDLLFEDEVEEEVLTPNNQNEDTPLPEIKNKIQLETVSSSKVEENVVSNKVEEKPKDLMKNRIDIDDIQTKSVKKAKPTTSEYEFTPPISPIFGIVGSDNTVSSQTVIPNKKKVINSSKLGTIISPYYGVETEEKTTMVIENKLFDDSKYEEEDINITLDDVLLKNETIVEDAKESNKVIITKNISLFDDEE